MSKLTQSIAILGVVAGLGVAALPLSTYAANPAAVEWNTTGGYTGAPMDEGATANFGTDAEGNNWVKTTTNIKLNVPDALSIDASADEVTLTDAAGDGKYTSDADVEVHVISRNNKGYTLSMVGSGNGTPKTDLVNSTFNIATGAIADLAAFDAATGTSAWGYRISEAVGAATATDANKYLAVAATTGADAVIAKETEAKDLTYKIGFGAQVAAGQAAGDYEGQVTFIATNNQ